MSEFLHDLKYSLEERDNDLFDSFYSKVFPNVETIELCEDMERQRDGIDKVIHFTNGNTVTIDEKKRRKSYGDIALEIWKNKEGKKPGWLYYSKCDYIVYAVMPTKEVYILPTLLLQTAWIKNKIEWQAKYPFRSAINERYTTVNICIPTDILLDAIKSELTKRLN